MIKIALTDIILHHITIVGWCNTRSQWNIYPLCVLFYITGFRFLQEFQKRYITKNACKIPQISVNAPYTTLYVACVKISSVFLTGWGQQYLVLITHPYVFCNFYTLNNFIDSVISFSDTITHLLWQFYDWKHGWDCWGTL